MPLPCKVEGNKRDSENCSKFTSCMNVDGELLQLSFNCPTNTIFSESNNRCDYKDNVPANEKCEN